MQPLRPAPRRPVATLRATLAAAALAAVGGCASVPHPNPADPLEGWNRGVQSFNDAIDNAALKPLATTYRDIVPDLLRTGVHNFFGNIGDLWSAANHFLQGKVESGFEMGMRVGTNTVFGLAGVLDPASELGLDKHSEDFGQTLGAWGFGPGPYIVWPLLGPSTLRDSAGLPLDLYAGAPARYTADDTAQWELGLLNLIDTRASLLGATELLRQAALDPYVFLRDAYLARRRSLVWDGNPPPEVADPPAAPAPASR